MTCAYLYIHIYIYNYLILSKSLRWVLLDQGLLLAAGYREHRGQTRQAEGPGVFGRSAEGGHEVFESS